MAKNTYETLLILDSNHYARDPGGVSKQVSDILTQAGGEVHVNRLWMEQKLAYPIDKHKEGIYVQLSHNGDGQHVAVLEKAMRLSEDVIRYLTVKQEGPLPAPRVMPGSEQAAQAQETAAAATTQSEASTD